MREWSAATVAKDRQAADGDIWLALFKIAHTSVAVSTDITRALMSGKIQRKAVVADYQDTIRLAQAKCKEAMERVAEAQGEYDKTYKQLLDTRDRINQHG